MASSHGVRFEATKLQKARYADLSLEKRVLALLSHIEVEQQWRAKIQALYEGMRKHTDREGGEISSRQLETLRESVAYYINSIVPVVDQYRSSQIDFLNPVNIILLNRNEASSVDFRFSKLVGPKALRDKRHRYHRYRQIVTKVVINPDDNKGKQLLNDLLYQVTSRIMALENISLGLIPFISNDHFRYVLTQDIKDYDSMKVEDVWLTYINQIYRSDTLEDLVKILNDNRGLLEENNAANKSLFTLINKSTVGSLINQRTGKVSFFRNMMANMRFMSLRRWDFFKRIGVATLYQASKIFGNTVGMVQFRRGKLYHMSLKEENRIANKMKPLDVMFEKTPFRLTDRFIPGHFGHNAIWAGTEDQLKEIGVWDALPNLFMNAVEKYGYKGKSFQADIRDGARIIEALRPGVEINSLRHFLDIDDLAVMRAEDCDEWKKGEPFCLTPKLKKEYLIKAFSQIGKAYDFAFDVNTEETIVCSELLYRTYMDIDFQTTYTVGSYNISPDQVAYQGDEEGDIFTPFILYHDGKEITKDLRTHFYDLLHEDKLMRLKEEALKNPQRSN